MRSTWFTFLILIILQAGCAHKEAPPVVAEPTAPAGTMTGEPDLQNPRALISDDEKAGAEIQTGLPSIDKFSASFEKLRLSFSNASIRLDTTGSKKKPGLISVKVTKGGAECQARLAISPTRVTLVEHITQKVKCRFDVTITGIAAASTDINLGKGTIQAMNWNQPLNAVIDSGDFDFENLGLIQLQCNRCNLSGSGASGGVRYTIGNGNIGIENLEGSVEGSSNGDHVLKWRKLLPGSKVLVNASAGDVIVAFPKNAHLSLELKVPRGEVYSQLSSNETVLNAQELRQGTPVSISAATGNVRILH